MPIVGFICPGSHERVPFDHFDHCTHGPNGASAFPPWAATAIHHGITNDLRHSTLDLTTTACYACPRQRAIEKTLDFYLNPCKHEKLIRGTALHRTAADTLNPAVWMREGHDPQLTMEGRLFESLVPELGVDNKYVFEDGIRVTTQIDCLKRDMTEMVNWKFPSDFSVRHRNKDNLLSEAYLLQANIERLLLSQQPWAIEAGLDPQSIRMVVWDHAVPFTPLIGEEYLDEESILDSYAWPEDPVPVSSLIKAHVTTARLLDSAPRTLHEALCAEVSCVGKYRFGKRELCRIGQGGGCKSYCDVHEVSERLKTTFPEVEKPW